MTARDPIDALAEVLRIDRHGGTRRPLWSDLDEADRETWRDHARFMGNGMARRGFAIVPQDKSAIEALQDLVEIIDRAGLINLSNGVQLGQTVWFVKASDRLDHARAVIAASGGTKA